MIWNPIISVLIFLLMLVPSVWIGFKKGWKSALLILICFISLNFIFLGIGILLYDNIWDIYKNIFLKKRYSIKMDIDILKESYRPRVLLLVSLFSFPLIALLTWAIQKLTKKSLTKHWSPKSTKVSSNNKKILIKSNSKKSKIIGGGILAICSIFVSSYVVSGINVLTMPLKRKNGFSKGTDFLANIYSAGLANNSDIPFYIDNFIKKADDETTEGISSLINFINLDNEKNIDEELKKSNVFKTRKSIFQELFKSEEASSEIIKSIISYENIFIDPLMWNKSIYQMAPDKYGNSQGYNDMALSSGKKRTMFINELEKYLINHPFNYEFPQKIKNLYIDILRKFLSDWDKTKFAKNILKIKDFIKVNEINLKKQISFYEDIKDKKIKMLDSRNQKIDNISSNMSDEWIKQNLIKSKKTYPKVKPNSFSVWTEFTWTQNFQNNNKYFIDKNSQIKNTKLQIEYNNFNDYKNDSDNKRNIANKAESERSKKELNFILSPTILTYQNAKNNLIQLEQKMNNNLYSLQNWTKESISRKERLAVINNQENSKNKSLKDNNDNLNKFNDELINKKAKLSNLTNRLNQSQVDLNQAINNYNNKKIENDQAISYYKLEKSRLENLRKDINIKTSLLNQKKSELLEKSNALKKLKTNDPQYSKINNDISDLNKAIDDINNELLKLQNQYNNKENDIKNKKEDLDRITIELASFKNDQEKKRKNNYDLQVENNKAQQEVNNLNDLISDTSLKISNLNKQISNIHQEQTILKGNQYNWGSIKEAESNVNKYQADYQTSKNSYNQFKKIYDPEYETYKNLVEKRDETENIALKAEQKTREQQYKIDEMIQDIINNLQDIQSLNKTIESRSKEIAMYDNYEVFDIYNNQGKDFQLLFDSENIDTNWLKNTSGDAKKSIYYFEAKDKAMKERLKTNEIISDTLKKDFFNMIDKIVNIYKKWINK